MPYKNKEKQTEYCKMKMRKIREKKRRVIPEVIPEVIPVPFINDIMRFELFYDTIRMKELLSQKTRFNAWMDKQLDVLDEIKEYHK